MNDGPGLASLYMQLMRKIAANRSVTLVAVSKQKPIEAIETLYHLGHRDFGESYVQELVLKARKLEKTDCRGIRWHLIGHLQTNKVKALIPYVHTVHSLDSFKLAQELAKRWKTSGRMAEHGPLPVFIEVNIDGAAAKSGVLPGDTRTFAEQVSALPELQLEGLMCVPEPGGGAKPFEALRRLEETCRPWTRGKLSMGMSEDYAFAIAEGATHVRIGTALFGNR